MKLKRRLVAILALKYSADAKTVSAPLIELLDDPNRNVRTAAIYALEGSAPKAALPKLKKVLDELEPPQAVYVAIRTIGLMEGKEASGALADFLEAAQNDPKKAKYVYEALRAFQNGTGQDWIEAGALRGVLPRTGQASAGMVEGPEVRPVQNGAPTPKMNCVGELALTVWATSKRSMVRSTKPNHVTSSRSPPPTACATGPTWCPFR